MTTKIAVFVGSLSQDSLNQQLAQAVVKLAPSDFTFDFVDIGSLPHYNRDDDENQPPSVLQMKDIVAQANGLLFVTPEYNRSIPGVLKNAIDHGSRPYGHNAWAGKPAGMMGTSPGGIGTALAQQHLRGILSMVGVLVLAQPDAYLQWREGMVDANGNIAEASQAYLQKWMDAFCAWVKANNR